ncbi:w0044 [Escherichia coli]|nr:w0044 [Escherichia coli]
MKIYHYTDLNGLKGIIESGSLWATHFSFLNDSNELTHGMNCLENALQYLRDDFNRKPLSSSNRHPYKRLCMLFPWNDLSTYPEARSSKQIHE